jgi:pimeloyl-ACP methyl ester carboxylesterase
MRFCNAGPCGRGSPRRSDGEGEADGGPRAWRVHRRVEWTGVIERLQRAGYTVLAPADPLRSLTGDARYVASVLARIKGPIVVVGHSYAGMVITNAAAGNPNVKALVYVSAYIPAVGESAVKLTGQFPEAS